MTVTKKHFINRIYNHCGYPKNISLQLFESLLEIIKSTLESGEDVMITRLGRFCVKEKTERMRKNPQTGDNLI
ncbi:MAG: HU family DNA-binding protein [Thermodesulfobacteriota bacterium]|nr:HU family DNA-binding protein [Thermodesulfobacteriota bacterium]